MRLTVSETRPKTKTVRNPYLDEFLAFRKRCGQNYFERISSEYGLRRELVKKYAWAIPDQGALDLLAKYGPLFEVGAGSGYWASLLIQMGVEILPYDAFPDGLNGAHTFTHHWTRVLEGDPGVAAIHPGRTLFLCWPPYNDPMGADCLKHYEGQIVAVVGESRGGCTGDDEFHQRLHHFYEAIEETCLPQWDGIHDYLSIHRRKLPNEAPFTLEPPYGSDEYYAKITGDT